MPSRPVPQTIACPKCGHEDTVTVWDTLDSEESPTAFSQLIDGSLFQHECSECGAVALLNYPCLFQDPVHRVMVYYIADDSTVSDVEKMFGDIERERERSGDPYKTHMRIVRSINTLREKATAFDDELDDRVVELVKAVFLVYASAADEMEGERVDEVYYSGLDDDGNLIMYMVGPKEKNTGTVPLAFYEKLEDDFLFGHGVPDDSYYIDYEWAIHWIDESGILSQE